MNLDYAYTRVGTEPVREFLLKKLAGGRKLEEVMDDERIKMYSEMPWETMRESQEGGGGDVGECGRVRGGCA